MGVGRSARLVNLFKCYTHPASDVAAGPSSA